MWQAQLDENNRVTNINFWEHPVGVPCSPDTPIGWQWNGTEFVEPVASIIKRYDDAMIAHFDAVAQQKQYDNRITCALRAGYPGPYQQDGIVFGGWMDRCNQYAYNMMHDVLTGQRELPSIDAFITELPDIVWPE